MPISQFKSEGGPVLAAQIEEGLLMTTVEEGPGDWINHSCSPNAGLAGQVVLVALRDIDAGEEICYDYAFTDSEAFDQFECLCGSLQCRGKVSGKDWELPHLQQQYLEYFSPYLQRRIINMQSAGDKQKISA